MKKSKPSERHHRWPVALQKHWADHNGNVWWNEPDGKTDKVKAKNKNLGFKRHGHTVFHGTDFVSNFESEFNIDNKIHDIMTRLTALKPLGLNVPDLIHVAKNFLRGRRELRDVCRFYDLDEKLHRELMLLIMSLLIRSPAGRSRFESYPSLVGLPSNEDVGKLNMMSAYRSAKEICLKRTLTSQYFVILRAVFKNFICGDGSLDWLSGNLHSSRLSGKALIPLTPRARPL